MTAGAESPHLDNRHRDTLRQIFAHPLSHNIEWRAARSLLEAVGTVTARHDGKVAIEIGSVQEVIEPPRQGHRCADRRGTAPDAESGRLQPVLASGPSSGLRCR